MPPNEEIYKLPSRFVFPHGGGGVIDWSDVQFILQEVEAEFRAEVLSIALETTANVHQSIAEGTRRIAKTIQGGAIRQEAE